VLLYHLNKDNCYYCDYFYQSATVAYSLRGGYTNIGNQCGIFLCRINIGHVGISTYFGASLSFKPLSFLL